MARDRNSCLFCRIADHDSPSRLVYEDHEVVAFEDINPRAPLHILIVPKKHIESTAELAPEDGALIGKIHLVAKKLAEDAGIAEKGYRLVCNCGVDGGQEIPHLHVHLLGGRFLGPYTFPLNSDPFPLSDADDE